LLDHGHPQARKYPIGMLADESSLVIARVNAAMVTEATLLQHAVHGVLSKKSREEFTKLIQTLNVETRSLDDEVPEIEG
jgi:hypothetical protein